MTSVAVNLKSIKMMLLEKHRLVMGDLLLENEFLGYLRIALLCVFYMAINLQRYQINIIQDIEEKRAQRNKNGGDLSNIYVPLQKTTLKSI